jgi:hypothetical protein
MKIIAFITEYDVMDRIIDGGRGPGLCPGVHFRREGSSLDRLNLTFVAEKPPPSHVIEQVALTAAEEIGDYF